MLSCLSTNKRLFALELCSQENDGDGDGDSDSVGHSDGDGDRDGDGGENGDMIAF